jgi:hypothetical protein
MDLKDRERKVEINKLDKEQINQLGIMISEKINQICTGAAEEVNKILSVYGLNAKMSILFEELPKNESMQVTNLPKKRGRKPKQKTETQS